MNVQPILYHPGVKDNFDGWAVGCGWRPETLRRATEFRIRNCHHQSIPEDHRYKPRPESPDIFRLNIGTVDVYYSRESHGFVVRGYGWDIEHEPVDDNDGGGYFTDHCD